MLNKMKLNLQEIHKEGIVTHDIKIKLVQAVSHMESVVNRLE